MTKEQEEAKARKKARKKVNDRTLLSFGDDEALDDLAGGKDASLKGGMKSMHDVAGDDRRSSQVADDVIEQLEKV